jgi:hypothetical protein
MRPGQKRALLWQGVGWLCYLVGLVLCLFTAVGVYLASPSGSFENATTADLGVLLAGVVLIVSGRLVAVTRGGSREMVGGSVGVLGDKAPEQSELEKLGYHIPPDDDDKPERDFTYEDGKILAVCEECGEHNDSEFEFCRNCSARLPE